MNAYICLLVVLGVVATASAGGKDVSYTGKYQSPDYTKIPEFCEVLKCMGFSDEIREIKKNSKFTLEFKKNKDNTHQSIYTYASPAGKDRQNQFEFGKEFDEKLMDGRVSKTTITNQSPTQLTKVQKFPEGQEATWVGTFSATEMTVAVTCGDKSVTMKYKRL